MRLTVIKSESYCALFLPTLTSFLSRLISGEKRNSCEGKSICDSEERCWASHCDYRSNVCTFTWMTWVLLDDSVGLFRDREWISSGSLCNRERRGKKVRVVKSNSCLLCSKADHHRMFCESKTNYPKICYALSFCLFFRCVYYSRIVIL
jgi:hypothetical protein